LVSCPIYLSPVTARTKSIRLHQVWQATPAEEPDEQPDRETGRDLPDLPASRPHSDQIEDRTEPVGPVSRITLRPHDPTTGEEVEKDEVVRGYEYERGQYVTFTPDELKALDLESSKVIDLEMFVPRGEVDPVYFNSPYSLYPDGQMAVETVRVIGAAMGEAGVVGIGRLTMSRRERMVIVEPRGAGMVLKARAEAAARRRRQRRRRLADWHTLRRLDVRVGYRDRLQQESGVGCAGSRYRASVGPTSHNRPRYIIATWSLTAFTTANRAR
jgi:hypothetical protein